MKATLHFGFFFSVFVFRFLSTLSKLKTFFIEECYSISEFGLAQKPQSQSFCHSKTLQKQNRRQRLEWPIPTVQVFDFLFAKPWRFGPFPILSERRSLHSAVKSVTQHCLTINMELAKYFLDWTKEMKTCIYSRIE